MGDADANSQLKQFFQECLVKFKSDITILEKEVVDIGNDVAYFGEQNTTDIADFFKQWEKFEHSFSAAIKYNKAQAKKEAALKAKEESKKKKEDEEKVLSKAVNTMRKSQANLKQLTKDGNDVKIDGFLAGKSRASASRRTKEREDKKQPKEVNSLVDDILSNNPAFTRPRRNAKDTEDKGTVKQLSKALRNSRTFARIRETTRQAGTDNLTMRDSETTQSTKQALQRQISSKLSRYK